MHDAAKLRPVVSFPGIFHVTDGHIRTADIGGPRLGIPDGLAVIAS
jgi:hypothetical protein